MVGSSSGRYSSGRSSSGRSSSEPGGTAQRRVIKVRLQLVAVNGTTDLWTDLMPFASTVGVKRVRGRVVLCEKQANFRFRVGIQTSANDPEIPDAPVVPASGAGLSYVSSVSRVFVDFDPRGVNEGNIDAKESYRLGLFYSSSDTGVSRGDVIVELYVEE